MPLKPEFPETMLGNSKMIASKRLDQLWTRLERDPTMKALYSDFLNEYESLHHMEEVKEDTDLDAGYYLPHHGILRPDNKTTKLRVVLNASSKTSSGYSLNDLLYKGGVLQEDLFSILIRFRKHIYAFTADIKQMFRMIELNESQTRLQKILWKNSKSSPTKVYELRTVTYGTASAPYLATKVLQQLALDEKKNFPLASKVLLQDFYMDDCLSGSSEFTEFETIQSELRQLLQRGGMTLHKWCSSYSPTTAQEFPLDRNSEEIQVKILGMIWNSVSDTFTYKANVNINHSCTKRDVLSQIARIYDPVGLLGPVISKAKIFMQQLWLLKLDWYEILPPDISQQWENFVKTLPGLEKIKIPRCFLETNAIRVILHGFADASSKGYGAIIYFQTVPIHEESNCRLLCSKSRVAPSKIMTIPRLELSACLLLSKLTHKVISALKMQIESVQLWSDSTIALAWINTPPNLLKTFISNRVSQIQQLTKDFQWKHIPSECNPADLISRGLDVKALAANDLWWKGPDLENLTACTPDSLPVSSFVIDECYSNELKTIPKLTLKLNIDSNFIDNLLDLTNNFHKLIRILAFIFRFITNCKSGVKQRDSLTLEEYGKAEIFLINHFQARYFAPEIACLKKGSSVSQSSKLKFLNPFIDNDGCIRVGGRISYSNVSCNQRHPIILPAGNKLVKLIFQYYHNRDFHVGQQALLNTVRLKYWPLGGRSIARKVVHECVECFKNKPVMANQIMGDLPPERITPSSPFQNPGLDLCGASAELKLLYKLIIRNETIANLLASEGIKWKFLPPKAPNFDGLWEAGVKSFKYHLKRVVGSSKLTLEEFLTVIVQIEGILNSRPLTPLSTDTDDFQVLTPGHFLIGKPINAIPEPDVTEKKDNLLNKWQKSVQIIWKRWQTSYLSNLQQRTKWLFKQPSVIPGMMVLIKDPQLPTCSWAIGRLIKSIPGPDGNIRVVDVRTSKGSYRRPLSKIGILPIKDKLLQK
ncbi:hypothetical protein AVEN_154690-1 [Araneus ventricosus]|uniref:DUF5641 domain-containing protein n=1 Tax=Araneus ventricosus TaxID=182803 RepID=A0A4Y2TEI0_ARAVE|nr:hypothetical protein AVEN_154690-1 [Araneus ventricosus]